MMRTPLDEKGFDAGTQALLNAFPMADKIAAMYAEVAIRAYLSATPAPDGLEVVAWLHPTAGWARTKYHSVLAQCLKAGPSPVALVRADQAQSALAAMRVERGESARKWRAYGDEMHQRAMTAEAQVKRLTEDNEALRAALGNMRCPRPCNHRPDEFDAKDCVAAGECGCGAAILSGGLNAPS